MTVSESKYGNKLLLWAVAISLMVHLGAYGGWKWSQTHPWWKKLALPGWMELGRSKLVAAIAKKLPVVVTPPQAPPLLYIDVDPNLASPEPPKNPKYYSSADTKASNPDIKTPSDIPQISGKQTDYAKTIPKAEKTVPLQPSPPKAEKQPEQTQVAEAKPLPKPTMTPGDLTFAKPANKKSETKGTNETETGTAAQALAQAKRDRPRTLADARAEKGLFGEQMQQTGGVANLAPDPTMDTARTPYGDYDREFIEAVRSRWYSILDGRTDMEPGKVVLEFDLHSDGRITGMTTTVNEVTLLMETFCKSAILDPAPFKPWSNEMRTLIADPRHLRFTFYYGEE
jgi:outer membrane biosynthesis protein TonB